MTEKKKYEKPSMEVLECEQEVQLLAGSNGGLRGQDYQLQDDPFADE